MATVWNYPDLPPSATSRTELPLTKNQLRLQTRADIDDVLTILSNGAPAGTVHLCFSDFAGNGSTLVNIDDGGGNEESILGTFLPALHPERLLIISHREIPDPLGVEDIMTWERMHAAAAEHGCVLVDWLLVTLGVPQSVADASDVPPTWLP